MQSAKGAIVLLGREGYVEYVMKKKNSVSRPTVHAAVFSAPGKPLAAKRFPVLPPSAGQVGLTLERSGICGTDVHIHAGRLAIPGPFIPGHEFIGRVDALGTGATRDALGRTLRKGDVAIVCVALPCGDCFSCRNDETASCLKFGVTYLKDPATKPHLFGGFSEYSFAPAANCIRIPPEIDLDAAAAFPCAGPTAIRAYDFAGGVREHELVVVQGTGALGLFAIAWAARAGATVAAIGSGANAARRKLARQLGASRVFDYREMPAEKRLAAVQRMAAKLGRGDGADVVFEASGAPSAVPEGLNLVRTRGRYIIPGQYSDSGEVGIAPHLITFKAIRITGSGQYKIKDVDTYLRFLKAHPDTQKTFAACITHRYRVGDVNRALADAAAGRSVKGVFTR